MITDVVFGLQGACNSPAGGALTYTHILPNKADARHCTGIRITSGIAVITDVVFGLHFRGVGGACNSEALN